VTHRRDCTGSEEGRRADRDWLRERFADCEITLSRGRTGQCWDNALAESFFASIKGELLDLQPWPTRAAARRAVVEYIARYNGTRLHSTLGYRSPAEYEEDGKIKNVA
jgi:transposase InsO family protein